MGYFVPVYQIVEDVDWRWNVGTFGCHANLCSRSIALGPVVHISHIIIETLRFINNLPSLVLRIGSERCTRAGGVCIARFPFR